jgi:hypothetical protein
MKFQVAVMDARDYINEYKNFSDKEIGPMLKYINGKVTEKNNVVIKITRWNDKGELA